MPSFPRSKKEAPLIIFFIERRVIFVCMYFCMQRLGAISSLAVCVYFVS